MIELTDEQIANTIERVEAYDGELYSIGKNPMKYALEYLFKSLTLDQIKQLAEQHNASVIQWIDFDANDEATWPDDGRNGNERMLK